MSIKSRVLSLFLPERRKFVGRLWLITSILYDIILVGIVSAIFHKHGVGGYVYFVYIMFTSVIFGVSSYRLVAAIVDHNKKRIKTYGVLTVLSFFAPEIYIIIVGRNIPVRLFIGLGIYVVLSTVITTIRFVNKVRRKRGHPKKHEEDVIDVI